MADEIKSIHLITRDGMVKKSTKKKRSAIMSLIADGSVQLSSVWRFSVWETMSPLISGIAGAFYTLVDPVINGQNEGVKLLLLGTMWLPCVPVTLEYGNHNKWRGHCATGISDNKNVMPNWVNQVVILFRNVSWSGSTTGVNAMHCMSRANVLVLRMNERTKAPVLILLPIIHWLFFFLHLRVEVALGIILNANSR